LHHLTLVFHVCLYVLVHFLTFAIGQVSLLARFLPLGLEHRHLLEHLAGLDVLGLQVAHQLDQLDVLFFLLKLKLYLKEGWSQICCQT
jgi:hypothetical protein